MSHQRRLTTYIGAFIDELVRSGIHDVVVSPGGRSTPLTLMMGENPETKVWLNLDERSAAFFALGMAKSKNQPVALLCTSGTAVANYFPAIIEAHYSRVPLVVITADRPHELRDIGAPQAIDQIKIFGNYVKWFIDMPLPNDDQKTLQFVRAVAGRAVSVSHAGPNGPVHLNFPLQEPLVPDLTMENKWIGGKDRIHSQQINLVKSKGILDSDYIRKLGQELVHLQRGLFVVGPQTDPDLGQAITKVASALGYPILADPLSQLRAGQHDKTLIIDSYDAFLRDNTILEKLQPQVIIRIGAMPVSKPFLLFLKQMDSIRHIVIDEHSGWREPTKLATEMIYADPVRFCQQLSEILSPPQKNHLWGEMWQHINALSKKVIRQRLENGEPFEGQVISELQNLLPAKATLFAGNSMPVRDLDSFYFNTSQAHKTIANRGANGIDGVTSTALGVAADSQEPVVLVIGDLSFYHDMNGLMAAKAHKINLKVIVVNNNGGGIFSFLPQSNSPRHFEELFGTPTELDFSLVAKLYKSYYHKVKDWLDFRETISKRLTEPGIDIIEVVTNRQQNTDIHRSIWNDVANVIQAEGLL